MQSVAAGSLRPILVDSVHKRVVFVRAGENGENVVTFKYKSDDGHSKATIEDVYG